MAKAERVVSESAVSILFDLLIPHPFFQVCFDMLLRKINIIKVYASVCSDNGNMRIQNNKKIPFII